MCLIVSLYIIGGLSRIMVPRNGGLVCNKNSKNRYVILEMNLISEVGGGWGGVNLGEERKIMILVI